MSLRRLRRHWQEFGRRDAFWAAMTQPAAGAEAWDAGAFYATGRRDVDEMVAWLGTLGFPRRWRQALDFGCGPGRLTRALARHCDAVVGVDIAETMLAAARHHAVESNCTFVANARSDLARFATGSFDLIVTRLVLQHLPPRYIRRYVRELVRVLQPGGALVFQLPVRPAEPPVARTGLRRFAPRVAVLAYRRLRCALRPGFPRMENSGLDRAEVERLLPELGARLVAVRSAPSYADRAGFEYVVTKPESAEPVTSARGSASAP